MFSESYDGEIKQYFDKQMALLKDRKSKLEEKEAGLPDADKNLYRFSRILLEQKIEEIYAALAQCSRDEAEALQFLYNAMPLSDLLDYPASVYVGYAKHGAFLWKEGPFAGKVPEKIFANYVLHHRVHNEDITDARSFFYREIEKRISGKNMYDAAVETNYWCAEKATYQTTFMRTESPMTMYKTAIGRCGEEAPFAVMALRSVGIPAREVAAPWWSHCDDNHAWVEAWCDGSWHFLGACEPEKSLDKGWFMGPASRAMLIDSSWFGREEPEEPIVGRHGMSAGLNHLRLYAKTVELTVKVEDEQGNPVPGARVDFAVLNFARFGSFATLYTGKKEDGESYGRVRLDTGFGDLLVCASLKDCYGEVHISLTGLTEMFSEEILPEKILPEEILPWEAVSGQVSSDKTSSKEATFKEASVKEVPRAEYTVVLRKELQGLGQWRELDFHAPRETLHSERMTEAEFLEEKAQLEFAAKSRKDRVENFYRKEDARRVLSRFPEEDREELDEILHQARGNMGEIVRFLEWDFAGRTPKLQACYGQEHWKLEALKTLKKNDYWDINAQVLAECSIYASPYADGLPKEIFFQNLLNPCAIFEFPRACRAALLSAFSQEQKSLIRKEPGSLYKMLDELVISMPEQEYANLIVSPVGCLTGGIGNEFSKAVLCIQIYRALGIPARMRPMDRTMECYVDGAFVPVSTKEAEAGGKLILKAKDPLKLQDWQHYSLSRFEKGRFMPLFIRPRKKKEDQDSEQPAGGEPIEKNSAGEEVQEFDLNPGAYRIVTTNRLPNGNQFVKIYDFRLQEKEEKEIELEMRHISVDAIVDQIPLTDFPLSTAEGEKVFLSGLSGEGKVLMLWLELTREPTEHILNELREKSGMFANLTTPMYFVIRRGTDYAKDETLMKTCGALPQAELLFDDFGDSYEALSYQVGRNPGKLPLAVILEGGANCIYSDCGYNVGMADMLLRILQ